MMPGLSLRFSTFMLRMRRAVPEGIERWGGGRIGVYVFYAPAVVREKGGLLGS